MIMPSPTAIKSKADLYRDRDHPPPLLAPDLAAVPAELRVDRRWVLWRLAWVKGRWTKVPCRADGSSSSSTDPTTWTAFDGAAEAYLCDPGRFAGVGFCLGGGWVGVDLDDALESDGETPRQWAADLSARLGTYTERSPSGTGLKLFGRGTWAGGWHRRPHPAGGEIEVYGGGRYFAVTGRPLGAWSVSDITARLRSALPVPAGRPSAGVTRGRAGPDDADLVRRAGAAANGQKFRALWAGGSAGHRSASEADLALCCQLAFWTDNDAPRIDAIFRQSGRMRDKWDERRGDTTYGGMTVGEAVRRTTTTRGGRWEDPPPSGATAAPADPPGWDGPPLPLAVLPPVPGFPLDVMPRPVADYWRAAAESVAVPVDYVAVPGLALLGAAVGRSRAAAVKRTFQKPPALWCVVVAPPSGGKSPALALAAAPLWKAEARWRDDYAANIVEYDRAMECHKVEYDAWKKGGCVGEPPAKPRKPTLRQAVLDDATAEAAARVLRDNPRGVALVKDELSGFVLALNQYKGGNGADRQFWLSAWAGAATKVNRAGDKDAPPLFVPAPFAAVAGALCPDMLPTLRGDKTPGDAPADGFIDRFLLSYPDAPPAAGETWREVPEAVERVYSDVVLDLLGVDLIVETDGTGERRRPFFIPFDAGGREGWERFTNALAGRLNALDQHDPFRATLGKLREYGLRLAGLIWCVRRACGELDRDAPIDAETMSRAATLVDYFEAHARRCHGVGVTDRTGRVARRLQDWLVGRPDLTAFTRSQAYQQIKDKRDVRNGDALNAPLALLCDHGFLRQVAGDANGRPGPAPQTFAVNPLWDRGANPFASNDGDFGDGFHPGDAYEGAARP